MTTAIHRVLALLALSMPLSAQIAPQAAEEQRWYQIEILVFASQYFNGDDERWREDLALSYPYNWVAVKDPEQQPIAGNELNIDGLETWELPEFEPLTDIDESSTDDPSESDAPPVVDPYTQPLLPESAQPLLLEPQDQQTVEQMLAIDLERQPFFLLPADQRSLEQEARSIRRSRNYRLLMHQAWRQPVTDEADAPHVLISAGDSYGDHQELEGSLSISVSRYLHLRTNLWFTRFVHNFGQQRGDWPELPVRPDRRQYPINTNASQLHSASITSIDQSFDNILSTPYIAERISLIKQRRRMRSGEMHYIDHPHMGIIILCTPYEMPPEEENPDKEESL